jgi:prevent-host-death family protein
MVQVGVRELKDKLSGTLRRAAAGEIIEVTEHGHPLARIVPIRHGGAVEQLIAEGRMTPAEPGVDITDYEPPPLAAGERLGSEILAELRADER